MSNPFETAGPAPATVQEEEKDNVLINANEDQTEAGTTVLDRLYGPEDQQGGWKRETKLDGKAGVGKTWLAKRIVEAMSQVTDLDQTIYLTAPTHQAVQELRENFNEERFSGKVVIGTLQSVMNLTVRWQGGERKLKKNKKRGGWSPEPDFGDILIVDESSMIGWELYGHVQDYFEQGKPMRVLWIGDDGQLPPVKDKSAEVLQKEGPTLEKIVRQAQGSAIIDAASVVREGGPGWKRRWMEEADGEEFEVLSDPKEMEKRVFSIFENAEDLYDARLVAFRRKRVRQWNERIKGMLYPNAEQYEEGMHVMSMDTYMGPTSRFGPLYSSQVLEVKEAEKKTKELAGDPYDSDILPPFETEVWDLQLKPARSDHSVRVRTITDDAKEAYDEELDDRKSRAKKGEIHWRNFYRLKEALADITYSYASTVHRAQGSSVNTVIVDSNDLLSAPGGDYQVQPLVYVALTRAAEKLIVLNN